MLPSRLGSTGRGEDGAGGSSTVGGESLRESEQVTAPDFTNLLWVLQMELYSLLTDELLGGAGLVTHSWIFLVGGWVTDVASSLQDDELVPSDRLPLDSTLLLSAALSDPLKLSLLEEAILTLKEVNGLGLRFC